MNKANYLVLLLFVLIMFSLSSVAANENVGDANNTVISLSCDNAAADSEIALGASENNSPLKADLNGGTFNDIQSAINAADSGDTVFLNGQNYSGNKQITVNKNIVIDGASSSNANLMSVLDANNASRIFYSNGNYSITLKNLVFENSYIKNNGYVAYFTGGNITLDNIIVQNYVITRNLTSGIYVGANSNVVASDITYKNNNLNIESGISGILFSFGLSTNISLSNLKFENNNISVGKNLNGMIYIRANSNVNITNVSAKKNNLSAVGNIAGGYFYILTSNVNFNNVNYSDNYAYALNSKDIDGLIYRASASSVMCDNFTINNNMVLDYDNFRSFMRAVSFSNATLNNICGYNNYMSGERTLGSLYSGIRSNSTINYVYIENNCVNDSYNGSKNQAGFITLQGMGILNNVHSLNNYVNDAYGGILRLQSMDYDQNFTLENSTFINTTLGASDIDLDIFSPSDHGGVLCVEGLEDKDVGANIRNCSFINNCNSLGGAITPHNHCVIDNCTFINNTATKYYGGAISTFYGNLSDMKADKTITIMNSYFEGNTAPLGGAIQANGNEVNIYGCTFVNNTATKGGAVFLYGDTIDLHNSTFINNTATDEIPSVLDGYFNWELFDWNVEGGAVYIYGSYTHLYNNIFNYNQAIGVKEDGCGGAVYVFGNHTLIETNHYDDNFAYGGNGSAIYLYGYNSTIKTSEFFNHTSERGTVYVIGNNSSILNTIFEHNIATRRGGAIYAEGDNALFDLNNFTDNNATIHGGAIHTHGDHIIISNSNFTSNHAIPDPDDIEQGLGGAIYIRGDYNEITNSSFDKNTARNGSAIYNRGHDVHITNDNFLENQAFSYLLITTATPKTSYYNGSNQVLINITLIGGDNIVNAIHNDGDPNDMFFYNVTYVHSTGIKITGDDEVHPVDGAENSENGRLLYQDAREDYQNITLLIVKDGLLSALLMAPLGVSGDVIVDSTYKTGLYGNVSLLLTYLSAGKYSVYSEHPEDTLYKQIDNVTAFEIIPAADLAVTKVVSNPTPIHLDEITWTITVVNKGISKAENVVVYDLLPEGIVYVSDDSDGQYDSVEGVWTIGDLEPDENVTLVITTLVNITNTTKTNVAVVTSDTEDLNESNNEDNDTITVVLCADVAVVKTVNDTNPELGDVVTWTVTVTNNGPDTAVNVAVSDIIPEGLEFVESDGNFTDNTWYIGDLANGDSSTLNIKTKVVATNINITNTANVTSDTFDNNLTNNEDNDTVIIPPYSDVAVVKVSDVQEAGIHDFVKWTITVTNNGPDTAYDVVVKEDLPPELEVTDIKTSKGNYNNGIWTIGSLRNGETQTLKLTTLVNIFDGSVENIVSVNTSSYDTNKSNNNDSATVNVSSQTDLELTIVSNKDLFEVGEKIVWTITVTNHGPNKAVNSLADVNVYGDVKFIKSKASKGTYDSSKGIWDIGDLDVGETVTLTLVYKALSPGKPNIKANVSSDTPETNMDNNNDTSVVEVIIHENNNTDDGAAIDLESSKPTVMHETGNPVVMIVLALFAMIFVSLKRIKL